MEVSCKAKLIQKDENGKPVLDDEGKEIEVEVPIKVNYDFGDNLAEMQVEFKEEAVFHHAKSSMTVALQSALRSWISQGLSQTEIEQKLTTWEMPTGKPRGRSKIERLAEQLGEMSKEDRDKVLEELGLGEVG